MSSNRCGWRCAICATSDPRTSAIRSSANVRIPASKPRQSLYEPLGRWTHPGLPDGGAVAAHIDRVQDGQSTPHPKAEAKKKPDDYSPGESHQSSLARSAGDAAASVPATQAQ